MKALEYLHLSLRRLVVLVVLAAVASLIAGGYTYAQPTQYRAESTVFVTRVFPTDASAVDSAVADFETVVGVAQVRRTVATQTGVSPGALASNLKFQRVGASSALQMTFRSTDPGRSANVVTVAAHTALTTLAQQQLDGANESVGAAQAASDAALKAVLDYEKALGVADLEAVYQARQQDLLNLANQLASATPAQAANITALIAAETQQVNTLDAARPKFQQLQDKLTEAQSSLAGATNTLIDAQGKMAAATSTTIVTVPEVTKQSRLLPVLRAALATALPVVVLGVGLFLFVDWLSRRRRLQAGARTDPDEANEPLSGGRSRGRAARRDALVDGASQHESVTASRGRRAIRR